MDETQEKQELHAIVHGLVQGVGFRATTQMIAQRLAICGTVRNLPNGCVEIHAQGTKAVLMKLVDQIKQAFPDGYIHRIDENYTPIHHHADRFHILR